MSEYDHDQLRRACRIAGPVALCHWVEGYREGITRNAVWKDGVQLVGVLQQPLEEVFAEIDAIAADLVALAGEDGAARPPGALATAFADVCVAAAADPEEVEPVTTEDGAP